MAAASGAAAIAAGSNSTLAFDVERVFYRDAVFFFNVFF